MNTVSQNKLHKLFLSELRQISINFNHFWWVDDGIAEVLCHIYIFHLTSLISPHYLVKKSTKVYSVSEKTVKIYSARTSSTFHQLHKLSKADGKIAKLLCLLELVLKVCPAHSDTSANTTRHWSIAASTIGWPEFHRSDAFLAHRRQQFWTGKPSPAVGPTRQMLQIVD